ncbi:MAG: hypothetical protein H6697_04935 [Myxococcales bacterium]|nr:hypothetical protein [Myxococcales bacterium]
MTFSVGACESCARDVLLARDLGDDDDWIDVCTRCGAAVPESAGRKRFGVTSVRALGYTFDDDDSGGCGSGGCGGACGSARETSLNG